MFTGLTESSAEIGRNSTQPTKENSASLSRDLLDKTFKLTKANVEPSKYLVMACQPIVDCLIENINKTYLTLFIESFLLFLFF